jgi:hypothetical protein
MYAHKRCREPILSSSARQFGNDGGLRGADAGLGDFVGPHPQTGQRVGAERGGDGYIRTRLKRASLFGLREQNLRQQLTWPSC